MLEMPVDTLRRSFAYEPETGVLTRRLGAHGKGSKPRAGTVSSWGYLVVQFNSGPGQRQRYLVHRVVWAMFYGEWPKGQIDHINGDKLDNRIANLRDVPQTVNQQNRRTPMETNTTGYLGVSRVKSGRFRACISTKGKVRWLGRYDTPEEAHAVYLKAKRELHEGNTL